jgi:hypothetical protein
MARIVHAHACSAHNSQGGVFAVVVGRRNFDHVPAGTERPATTLHAHAAAAAQAKGHTPGGAWWARSPGLTLSIRFHRRHAAHVFSHV